MKSGACHFNLVAKLSLALKLQILKVEVAVFCFFYVVKKRKIEEVQLSSSKISKPSVGFPTKLKWQALDIYKIEWPKVGGHY